MSVLGLSAAAAVALLIVAPALIRVRAVALHSGSRSVRKLFLRFAAAAAVSGIVAGITVSAAATDPSPLVIAAANAAIVAGPAYFWAGMRQLRARSPLPGWLASGAIAVTFATSIAVTVPLAGPTDGFSLRLSLVALCCTAVATEAFLLPARTIAGFVVTGAAFAVYGAYSLARLVTFFAAGPESLPYQTLFSPLVAASVSVPLVLVLCGSVWWSDVRLAACADRIDETAAELRAQLARHGALTVYDIEIPDLSVIRAAFGSAAARAVDAAANRALRDALTDAVHRTDAGRHLAAVPGEAHGDLIDETLKDATARALPALDYREAIAVHVTHSTVRSEAELARVWPDIDLRPMTKTSGTFSTELAVRR